MGSGQVDVSGIQPEAREIARTMAEVYITHLGSSMTTFVVHGSAVKGGIIAGSSDVDVAVFVDPVVLDARGALPLERALALHADLARIDPAPFRYLQGHLYPHGAAARRTFMPGTFHVVWGAPDIPLADPREAAEAARTALGGLDPAAIAAKISLALLDHGEDRLDRQVRWLCTDLWPAMYQVACLRETEGMAAWGLTKQEVVDRLGSDPIVGPAAAA